MGTCNFLMSEESEFNNALVVNPCFFPKFIPSFFPPRNILPNLMFLYTVTTLQDAVHWLFILGLTVPDRKGQQCIMTESHQDVCLFVWNKSTQNIAVYTDAGLQEIWARAVSAFWNVSCDTVQCKCGKENKCSYDFLPPHFCPEPPCTHRHIPLRPRTVMLVWLPIQGFLKCIQLLRYDSHMGGTGSINDTNFYQSVRDGLKNESL